MWGVNPTVTFHVGDVLEVLRSMPDQSVHSVITSPPYWRKRAYLPASHPDAERELGQENTPGEFLASLLAITDELWRIVRDDGTIWINLGDTASESGGAGGDYAEGGMRQGQNKYGGSATAGGGLAQNGKRRSSARQPAGDRTQRPLAKSVCWIPELFGASLAYGRNLLTGEPCRQWITRPPVTWCKPAPTPGEIIDKFREATELFVWAAKEPRYYFDLDAVRQPQKSMDERHEGRSGGREGWPSKMAYTERALNPKGAPPLNWWKISTSGYNGAHFATFPPELIYRPVIVSCPEGGTILDPFGGSGTTAMVAIGNNRSAILIDIDERNVGLAQDRLGLFVPEVVHHSAAEVVA